MKFSSRNSSAHSSLVGIGAVSVLQITHEAKSVLEAADVLYVLHAQSLVLDYLREHYDVTDVVDLSVAYDEDKPRSQPTKRSHVP